MEQYPQEELPDFSDFKIGDHVRAVLQTYQGEWMEFDAYEGYVSECRDTSAEQLGGVNFVSTEPYPRGGEAYSSNTYFFITGKPFEGAFKDGTPVRARFIVEHLK